MRRHGARSTPFDFTNPDDQNRPTEDRHGGHRLALPERAEAELKVSVSARPAWGLIALIGAAVLTRVPVQAIAGTQASHDRPAPRSP